MPEIQIPEQILKTFFNNVNAEDKNEICFQYKPPFVFG
jgi:hypothetical protein